MSIICVYLLNYLTIRIYLKSVDKSKFLSFLFIWTRPLLYDFPVSDKCPFEQFVVLLVLSPMEKTAKKAAIVIGAGIGGLATAIRLINKGFVVNVFEANGYPGGKLSEIQLGDYRFDAGPSLFTLAHLVTDLFELSGKNPQDYFEYETLETICHYFYEDGTRINAYADASKFANEIAQKTKEDAQKVLNFLKKSAELYEITAPVFLEKSLHKTATYFNKTTFRSFQQLHKINALKSMFEYNNQYFKDERVVQLFNRFATYNGSNPYKAPATLNVIPHLEHNLGAFFPKKGMHSITTSLFKLAQELGVVFHFNQRVNKILIEQKQALGIQLVSGEKHKASVVVSNMDVFYTYKNLLPNEQHPKRILQQEKSSSALIFYWGIKKQLPELGLHNIFFSKDYKAEFNHIFDKKTLYNDPTIYVNISSKHQINDAPKGAENWFVMINTPYNAGQNWEELVKSARQNILNKLNRVLSKELHQNNPNEVDLAELIECESILSPPLIDTRTASHLGALYGNSSNNRMAAFSRHPNFSKKIKNLYFCGGSVHPGGGIPLSLLSAKIVGELVSG